MFHWFFIYVGWGWYWTGWSLTLFYFQSVKNYVHSWVVKGRVNFFEIILSVGFLPSDIFLNNLTISNQKKSFNIFIYFSLLLYTIFSFISLQLKVSRSPTYVQWSRRVPNILLRYKFSFRFLKMTWLANEAWTLYDTSLVTPSISGAILLYSFHSFHQEDWFSKRQKILYLNAGWNPQSRISRSGQKSPNKVIIKSWK